MTDLLDPEKHKELRHPAYLELLGKLAQEDRTPTEDKMAIEAAFVELMKGFWTAAYKILPVSAGGLATDDAMEAAIGQVADKLNTKPQELKGVAFDGAFHGRYGHGAEGTANIDKVGHKHTGRTDHVTAPILQYDKLGKIDEQKTKKTLRQSIKEVAEKLKDDKFAYVVCEFPIQAEGGARIVNPKALSHLYELCQKYGKPLVVDCVQMGGRAWTINENLISPFAQEVLEFADIITFGKIFHVNGTMLRDFTKLGRGFKSNWVDTHGPKALGGTWTGHISQMASGYAIIQTVLQKKLYQNAINKAQYILSALQKMAKKYPVLTNVRGRSDTAYLAWSFADSTTRDVFKKRMIENEHIIFLTAGDNSIRLAPCADMTLKEVDSIIGAIDNQLRQM